MMKKIAITGPTGMLGSMVYNLFREKYKLILIFRDIKKFRKLEKVYSSASKHQKVHFDLKVILSDFISGFPKTKISPALCKLVKQVGTVDTFINCTGIINKYASIDPPMTFFINSILPHLLSSIYKEKLVHVTTDCVFSGLSGAPYNETSPHTPTDLYGLTKSLGEPYQNSLVFRTSLIGPEIANYTSILEWFKKQKGETVLGFTNHLWNGITTKQFALILQQIIDNQHVFPKHGLFHIFSTALSKYEILTRFNDKYKLGIRIKPYKTSCGIDRRLTSRYNLVKKLRIPSFTQMLTEL